MLQNSPKPTGLSQSDQVVLMLVVAIILLLLAAGAYIFSANPEVIPQQLRPNPDQFFEKLENTQQSSSQNR